MNRFLLSIAAVACALVLAISASAQGNAAAGHNLSLSDVAIKSMQRTVLHDDIAHYTFDVAVGPGQFDRIRLHRVVREKRPYQPIQTVTGVVLFPGSPNSFEMIFMEPLISNVPAWDQSVTAFLAKNDIDVWGMDYRWALVSAGTTDFGFMKTWGLKRDVDDAKIALSLVRLIRGGTGQGFGQLNILGFSYGTFMSYSIANQETQVRDVLRNAKGMIAVDWGIVLPPGSQMRQGICDLIPPLQSLLDAGTYSEDTGLGMIADLARTNPDAPSDFAPGFTNYQFALFVGASVFYAPTWHFVAGVFDQAGVTTDLQYTDPWLWIDVIRVIPTSFPVKADLDADLVNCYNKVAPFSDHLGQITLPILYVGAAGGTGETGYYAVNRTSSKDVTKFTIRLHSKDEATLDFGHADLFTARDAETLVWQPILHWLLTHP